MLTSSENNITTIAIGSVYGAAEYTGFCLAEALTEHGLEVNTTFSPTVAELQNSSIVFFVTSTTGQGELPPKLRKFQRELSSKPDLNHLNYAVCALGDSSYGEYFCKAGIHLDQTFKRLGASQLSHPLLIDAESTNNPEKDAVQWAVSLIENQL